MSAPRFQSSWTSVGALANETGNWLRLLDASEEPNPFYAPDVLLASEQHLHGSKPIQCLAIRDNAHDMRLCGLLPLERPLLTDGMLRLIWSMYRNTYTCSTVPLVERGLEKPVLAAALVALEQAGGPSVLAVPQLVQNSAIAIAFDELARERGLHSQTLETVPRALVESELSADEYRRTHWSKARRSKIRRKLEALKALGEVRFSSILGSSEQGHSMIDAFLTLEAAGWKGKAGTALASKPGTMAFALQAHSGHAARPEVLFETLTLDGKIIAMNINLVGGNTGFTVKTAYDETYAKHSPGLLLDGEALSLACRNGVLKRLDSCAAPGHPLEDIWAERRDISYLLLSLRPGFSAETFNWLGGWIKFAREMRARRHPKAYTTKRGAD